MDDGDNDDRSRVHISFACARLRVSLPSVASAYKKFNFSRDVLPCALSYGNCCSSSNFLGRSGFVQSYGYIFVTERVDVTQSTAVHGNVALSLNGEWSAA